MNALAGFAGGLRGWSNCLIFAVAMRVALGGRILCVRSKFYPGPHFKWESPCRRYQLDYSPPVKVKRLLPPPFFVGAVCVKEVTVDLNTAIEAFRASEVKETAAIVLQDKDLQRVLAAWPQAPREVVTPSPWPWSGPADWNDLWNGIRFAEVAVIDMTGLQPGRARVALRRAIALRLIYPDGTLHHLAQMVLQRLLKDSLTGKRT